jgi:hypothetical protein
MLLSRTTLSLIAHFQQEGLHYQLFVNSTMAFMKVGAEIRSVLLRESSHICTVHSHLFDIDKRDITNLIGAKSDNPFKR